jgi:glycopeptide antibiotics resistance protein
MFVPTGIVLPVLYKRLDNFFKVVGTGFLISLSIEILQLPFADRASDVDDLIMNTLGVATGYVIYMIVRYAKSLGKQKANRPGVLKQR